MKESFKKVKTEKKKFQKLKTKTKKVSPTFTIQPLR